MTNTDISRLYKNYLSKVIPLDFKLDKGILYKTSVNNILVGFCFERSSSEKESLYVWSFAMPLYLMKEDLSLTFGQRLKRGKNEELWHFKNNPQIDKTLKSLTLLMQKEIKDFFPKVETPKDFFEFYKDSEVKNVRIKEALVYSGVYAKHPQSKELLKSFTEELENEDLTIQWIKDVLQNSLHLQEVLDKNGDVDTLLNQNIKMTKSHLKIK